MKNILLFAFFLSSFIRLVAQENSFFFNVLSPSAIYDSYGPDEIGYTVDWGVTVEQSIVGELALAPEGDTELPNSFCAASDEDFTGKFVLIKRGECLFADKVHWAEQSGAIGVLIGNVEGEIVSMAGSGDFFEVVNIPAINIDVSLTETLTTTLESGTVVVEFSPDAAAMAHTVGNVGIDANGDCLSGEDEIDLAGWKVTLTNDEVYRLGFTDVNGNYDISSNIGSYLVSVEAPNDIWNICDNQVPVVHTDFSEQEADFAAIAIVDCAQLSVDMIAPFWRRCFENQLVINYCNTGSITAENTYVTLELPSVIQILLTNIPYTVNDEGLYVFNVGDDMGNMGVGECGTINLLTEVSCDAELGQTLCAEAYGYPNAPCVNPSSNWSGASIVADSNCGSDVVLSLTNTGTGDMTSSSNYRIFRNAELIDDGMYQLTAGNSQEFTYENDGATYRIEATPEVTQPFFTAPSSSIEGCGGGDVLNFITQFSSADYGQSHEELCLEVIGAYDPNDKNANPRGYGEEHYIDQNTSLEYYIRFQNTGTDTAFNVVVLDTLSASFDVNTLQLGASSHAYDLRIIENHILEFTFADIQLVDSFANEPASHGFFSYELKQNVDVELGTIIENSAAIYFDFNEPVITNVTFHEVGKDFINPTLIHCPVAPNAEATFAPSPMADQTTVVIHNAVEIETGLLEIFDANGKMILTQKFVNPQFTIQTQDLPVGAYFYRYYLNAVLGGSGKVVK